MARILVENVHKKYKDKKVLNGLSFICENEILFLAGKNGAGKTTLIRLALGLDTPDKGSIAFLDNKNKKDNKIGVVFDTPCLFGQMTCKENINILCTGYLNDKEYVQEILDGLNINDDLLRQKASNCSFGQQHRVSVAVALIRKPMFLFLDEPTVGLDPVSWELVRNSIIKNKEQQNGCVIITGQDYFEMADFSDKILILDNGKSKYFGGTKDLISSFPVAVSVVSSNELPTEFLEICKEKIENSDKTYTYRFKEDVTNDMVIKLLDKHRISVNSLMSNRISLKEAVYKIINGEVRIDD